MTRVITKHVVPKGDCKAPAFRHGLIAGRAEALAKELNAVAAQLRAPGDSASKDAIAAEVSKASWAIRGIREDKAVRIAFVLSVEEAIEHIEYWRASVVRARIDRGEAITGIHSQWRVELRTTRAKKRLSMPYASAEVAGDILALSPWLADASFASEARDLFAVEFPEHARRIPDADYAYAVRAMRGETPAKWDVLAEIIVGRLKLATEADTLRHYIRKYRSQFVRA